MTNARPKPRKRWRELPADERRATLALSALVPVMGMSLRLIDYRRTMAVATWSANRFQTRPTGLPVERWHVISTRVERYSPLPGKCLSRSLALWWLLRQSGRRPELRIGVAKPEGAFAAHAWVELDGQVLNDRPDVRLRYPPLSGNETIPRLVED